MEYSSEINVKDALERLSLPSIFNDNERITAYYTIIEHGNSVQKVMAEKAIEQYPLQEVPAAETP